VTDQPDPRGPIDWARHYADQREIRRQEPPAAADDQPRITPNPDGGALLHLPEITYLDTQVWAVDIGLTADGLRDLRAVLVGELQAATEATEAPTSPEPHVYLSTGCLHGEHDYCAAMTGMQGAKRPATCKFCQAPCQCGCHQEQPAPPPAASVLDMPPGPDLARENAMLRQRLGLVDAEWQARLAGAGDCFLRDHHGAVEGLRHTRATIARVREAAALHRQGLISLPELHAAIGPVQTDTPEPTP
jgi:hypothetical protein